MKKLYTLILSSVLASGAFAQTYYPMLDSINVWSYASHLIGVRHAEMTQAAPCSYPLFAYGSFKQYTEADTLIGSYYYKPVMNTLFTCTMGYMREDTAARKVYFIDQVSPTEKLIYDYSMQVGDTMTINFFMQSGTYASGVYTLDSIGSQQILAGTRRTFHLSCHDVPSSAALTWVESIGNEIDLLYPYFENQLGMGIFQSCPGFQHQFGQFMICVNHADKIYDDPCSFQTALANMNSSTIIDSCDYYSFIGAVNEMDELIAMDVFPNPSAGSVTISLNLNQKTELSLIVHDLAGKQIIRQIGLGEIPQGKTERQINLSDLPEGFYLAEIHSAEGSAFRKLIIQH